MESHNLHEIQSLPNLAGATSTPLDELVEFGYIQKPRLFQVMSSSLDTNRFQVVEYSNVISPAYAFNLFAYNASNCFEADYYRMIVMPTDIDSIVAITQTRPNYADEIWYYSIGGVGNFSNQACVDFVFSYNFELETMESFAQFTANITGLQYFPWILDAPEAIQTWEYPSSSFDEGYNLGNVVPPVSCTGEYEPNNFWTCEVQMVGCPDLNGDDYVDMDDLLEFLPVYDTPVNCEANPGGSAE